MAEASMITFELPWPEAALAQNARGMWAKHAGRKKKARIVAKRLTAEALVRSKKRVVKGAKLNVALAFHPPPINRRRDIQNVIGSLKYAIDGIADAVGMDDSDFRIAFPLEWSPPIDGGKIVVTLS